MFRTGTTSYIIPADILPNVVYLAPQVDDVELVLFETDEYGSNLPDAGLRSQLGALAETHNLTYTVHLPLDLRLGAGGEATDQSLVKARRVIEATCDLNPYAYTVHLDGRELVGSGLSGVALEHWRTSARQALEIVCGWLDEPEKLCVENVERWNPDAFAPLIEALPISRTIDIGHLWLEGVDPLPRLEAWIERARVVHLHGIATRDHASLSHVPQDRLDPAVDLLCRRFSGVVTLEVFNREDFVSSVAVLAASVARVSKE